MWGRLSNTEVGVLYWRINLYLKMVCYICILSLSGAGDGGGRYGFGGEIFFFLFRLVGIVDPQWNFGPTLANRLAL